MRIKEGLILRKIIGVNVVVPVGKRTKEIRGIIVIPEGCAQLWERMLTTFSTEDLVHLAEVEYPGLDIGHIRKDVDLMLGHLRRYNILDLQEEGNQDVVS